MSVEQMEEIAAESQALVDKALAMVLANALTPDPTTTPRAPVDGGESDGQPTETSTGTDVDEG